MRSLCFAFLTVPASLLSLLALLGSLISLCVGSSYAKSLFPDLGIEGVSALRIGFSMVLLWLVLQPWRMSWSRADVRPLAVYGFTLGLMNLLFYESIGRIPLGLAIAIEFTGPLAVAIWHSHRWLDGLWVALAATGLLLLVPLPGWGDASGLDPVGVAYALAAAVCWALYIVQGQRVARRFGMQAVAMGMAFAALLVVPVGLMSAQLTWTQPAWWGAGLGVALFSSALPYALEMFALRHLPRHTFSVCLSLEPVIGALAAWLMLAETLSLTQGVAIGLVMSASMGSAWQLRQSN
jgi:inner membrane transporter RhtA